MQASLESDPQAMAARALRTATLTAFCYHTYRPEEVNAGRR